MDAQSNSRLTPTVTCAMWLFTTTWLTTTHSSPELQDDAGSLVHGRLWWRPETAAQAQPEPARLSGRVKEDRRVALEGTATVRPSRLACSPAANSAHTVYSSRRMDYGLHYRKAFFFFFVKQGYETLSTFGLISHVTVPHVFVLNWRCITSSLLTMFSLPRDLDIYNLSTCSQWKLHNQTIGKHPDMSWCETFNNKVLT